MANLMDYLDWRGDLTLEISPFNEVDALILAELSFVDFDGIVPPPELGRGLPLCEAAEAFFARHGGKDVPMGVLVPDTISKMLRKLMTSPRFRNMTLNGYTALLDDSIEQQFAALTIDLGNGSIYISFRGTDDTIVGWKEDLNMGFLEEIPSQKQAVEYVARVARQYSDKTIRIGGHSKGGNLAVYSAAKSSGEIQERIVAVHNNDAEVSGHAVVFGVETGGFNRERIDITAFDRARAEHGGRDRENAGAAAVVKNGFAFLQILIEPLNAEMRGRMASGAEGDARIELHIERVRGRRFGPGGHNPEPARGLDRLKLSLRDADPVNIRHSFHGLHFKLLNAERLFDHGERCFPVETIVREDSKKRAVPGLDLGFQTRFAEEGGLRRRIRVCVLRRVAASPGFHQHVADRFSIAAVGVKRNFLHFFS